MSIQPPNAPSQRSLFEIPAFWGLALVVLNGCQPSANRPVSSRADVGPSVSFVETARAENGGAEKGGGAPVHGEGAESPQEDPPLTDGSDLEASDEAKPTEPAVAVNDWPNWMGPNHDGVSKETGWSVDWPEKGLPVVWKQDIGIGFSSVAIANGRVYSMGHRDGVETVYCLDIDSGRPIWTHQYPSPLVDNLYEGGPGATPTVDDGLIYTLGKGGRLICFNEAKGDVVWQCELQDELDVELPEWGFNSSPYIVGEKVILEAGRVVAFNKKSGEKLWQTAKHIAGYGSARVFQNGGRSLLASLDCAGLRVVTLDDGVEIAFYPWESPFRTNSTTPIILPDGKIYISTAYNVGCGLFTLNDKELELEYSNRDMRNHFNNSILLNGKLYGFDGNSNLGRVVHLTCMDAATGERHWRERGMGCGSLMIADNRLIILSEQGELIIADATHESFRVLARSPFLDGRCWTVPVLHAGRVYGRNAAGTLLCVKLPASAP